MRGTLGSAVAGHSARWCAGAGYDPPPRTLTAPLGGGGGQPCTGLGVVLPPVRKSPVSRAARVLSWRAALAGRFADTGVRARRAKVHDSGVVVHSADVRRVRARGRAAERLAHPAAHVHPSMTSGWSPPGG